MKVIVFFIMFFLISFNCSANDNYYANLYTIEYKKSSDIIGQTIESRVPFVLMKGNYENCNGTSIFEEGFNCLSSKESSHYVKFINGYRLISYNKKKQLKAAISYKVYKEYRLVHKTFWGRTLNTPVPMVLLKTRDGKTIEIGKLTFYLYLLNDNTYRIQDDTGSSY